MVDLEEVDLVVVLAEEDLEVAEEEAGNYHLIVYPFRVVLI